MYSEEQIITKVKSYVQENGLPPSTEILARGIHISYSTLKKLGTIRDILHKADVSMDFLPASSSQFERSVYALLREEFSESDIVYQKRFSACRDYRAFPFDFYIKSINLVIEADGEQHYAKGKPEWHSHVNKNDAIKNAFCKENGIALLRVRHRRYYWNKDKLKKIIHNIQLLARETGQANCFNCWNGEDKLLPISSQADIGVRPKKTIRIETLGDITKYTAVMEDPSKNFTCVCDTDFAQTYLEKSSVYVKSGKLYMSCSGKLAANLVLNITGTGALIVQYKNGNTFDIRRENLLVVANADVARPKRGAYKNSTTGDTRMTMSTVTVKGHKYTHVVAKPYPGVKSKRFNIDKYGSKEAAIKAAKDWLESEGSETIPKGSRDQAVSK